MKGPNYEIRSVLRRRADAFYFHCRRYRWRKAGEMNNEFLLLLFWALFIFAPRRVEKAEKALSFRRRSQLAG